MNRRNRPSGREKEVGAGEAQAKRRGSWLGRRQTAPVGNEGGYAERTAPLGGAGPPGGPTGGTRSTGRSAGGGCLQIVAVIAVALYLAYSSLSGGFEGLFGSGGGPAVGYQPPSTTNTSVYVDQGAYAINPAVSQLARPKRTELQGGGADTATIMIYMCATDLESQSGMATADLNEMLYAEISDKVNVIVETGGTVRWQNNVISSRANQRYRVTSKGLEVLAQNLGRKSMVNPATLADFVKFCADKYPADRYWLILWDHGGGSATGFGYDQNFPGDSMTLDEIGAALKNAGCVFEVVGFDACLMATLETAMVLEPFADYMIASEETEPGIGWEYTGWLSRFSANTSTPVTDLAKQLIDDYVVEVKARTPGAQATLSLIDLAELKGTIPTAFSAFSATTAKLIDDAKYKAVADARAATKEFSPSSRLNQIDLIHFAENLDTTESRALAVALRSCIKYNRTSTNITNANGVSIFFPYSTLSQVGSVLNTYDQIGMDEQYRECVRSFASVMAGGQVTATGGGSLFDILFGGRPSDTAAGQTASLPSPSALLEAFIARGDYGAVTGKPGDSADWLDVQRMRGSLPMYQASRLDAAALKLTQKDGHRVLALTEEQWSLVQYMEMNVFLDDGEGYIDLGLDSIYQWTDDGDLVMEFDGTWLTINGRVVAYYFVSEDRNGGQYTILGRVPALLNGALVDIMLAFDNQAPGGKVLGALVRYDEEAVTATQPKGLLPIVAGDKIDFLCDFYSYEGQFTDTYYLGDQYIATGQWTVRNLSLGESGYQMTYRITDIYGNQFWTPSVVAN